MSTAVLNFDERIVQERKKTYVKATLLNFLLSYYFLFAAFFLYLYVVGGHDELTTQGTVFGWLAVPAAAAAIVWSKFPSSPGCAMVERTHSVLKNTRGHVDLGVWFKSFSGVFCTLSLLMTVLVGWLMTEMNPYSLLSADGMGGAQRIFKALVTPEMAILPVVLEAMVVTIFIALMATAIALPFAFISSFFMARNLMNKSAFSRAVYAALRFVANFARSVEPLIWAIIFSVWVGIGPFAGMMSLMLHSVASLAKMYSEVIEDIDRGPMEALEATGANQIQIVWYGVVPQVVLPFLSFTIFRWDINIRMATIIGMVGGGGVGTLLTQYQGLAKWNEVGTIIIVIAIVVWAMDYATAKIREAIY